MFDTPDASVDTVTATVATTGAAVTFTYPAGRSAAFYGVNGNHKITGRDYTELLSRSGEITITFGATTCSVVNNTERAFKAGQVLTLNLDLAGHRETDQDAIPTAARTSATEWETVYMDLGAPLTADADGFFASQDLTTAGAASVSTTVAAAIAAAALAGIASTFTGRNVVAAWTGAAVITITGTDMYGDVMVESSGSGTSLTGKKAFQTVTGISVSANVTGLTVGTGLLLGLPIFVPPGGVLKELDNAAVVTNGTIAYGVTTDPATATTGDVRGTYAPNAAPNGTKRTAVLCAVPSKSYVGLDNFAG